jgi:hypothetical protein
MTAATRDPGHRKPGACTRWHGLGRQILGQVSADAPGDEPVNGGEVLTERDFEIRRRLDGTGSQFLVHM